WSEHGDDGDHQHQEGEGDDDIDDPSDEDIRPAPEEAAERADDGARGERNGHANGADLQVDPCGIEDAREHVAPEIVGAEGMDEAGGPPGAGGGGGGGSHMPARRW